MFAAKPQLMKLVNEGLIRSALLARGEASNADLVLDTGLSQTTVKQALAEMLAAGLIKEGGKRASSGGRRASAWVLDPAAWSSLAMVVESDRLVWARADALGSVSERGAGPVLSEPLRDALSLAAELKASAAAGGTRCALAVGLPGAVKDGRIITGDLIESWAGVDLRASFAEATGLPIVVESDLNAIALGYARARGSGGGEPGSLAYIQFGGGACLGSGLVFGDRIFRGASSFSGELGYLPMGNGLVLDEVIGEDATDGTYAEAIASALAAVNCVVNPSLLALGGRGFRFALRGEIAGLFEAAVDAEVRPELAFVENADRHYLAGLTGLAAEELFPSIHLVERRQRA